MSSGLETEKPSVRGASSVNLSVWAFRILGDADKGPDVFMTC